MGMGGTSGAGRGCRGRPGLRNDREILDCCEAGEHRAAAAGGLPVDLGRTGGSQRPALLVDRSTGHL